jgi:N utilization substance protein B
MTRTIAREIAVRLCFSISENPSDPEELLSCVFDGEYYSTLKAEDKLYKEKPDDKQMEYITRLVRGIHGHAAELDGYIDKYAVGWKYGRISRTAAAIMKTAMYEVLYMPDVPDKAAINEAVELAKRYEPPETVSFINGVLGSFSRAETSDGTLAPRNGHRDGQTDGG